MFLLEISDLPPLFRSLEHFHEDRIEKVITSYLMSLRNEVLEVDLMAMPMQTEEQEPQPPPSKRIFFLLGFISYFSLHIFVNTVCFSTYSRSIPNITVGVYVVITYFSASLVAIIVIAIINPEHGLIVQLSAAIVQIVLLALAPLLYLPVFKRLTLLTISFLFCLICLLGAASGTICSLLFSAASNFTKKTFTYISAGSGFCALFTIGIRVLFKALFNKPSHSIASEITFIYFMDIIHGILAFYYYHLVSNSAITTAQSAGDEATFFRWDSIVTFFGNWVYWVSMFLCTFVTYSLLPNYLAEINFGFLNISSEYHRYMAFSLFIALDFVGKLFSLVTIWPNEKYAWTIVICRVIFYPAFTLSMQGVIYLSEKWWSIVLFSILALTQGYLETICFIHGICSKKIERKNRKLSAFIMLPAFNLAIIISLCIPWKITPK